MRWNEIPKRTENAVNARIESTVRKYGYDAFRTISTRYMNDRREKEKLQEKIRESERKLAELKKKR